MDSQNKAAYDKVPKPYSAQEAYDEFLAQKIFCPMCESDVLFSEVVQWMEPEGGAVNVMCPQCDNGMRVDDSDIKEKMQRLATVDKRIAKVVIDVADAGRLKDEQDYKIAMIIKYHSVFIRHWGGNHPLSYVDRKAMRLVYDKIIADELANPAQLYDIKAPVPISFEQKFGNKVIPPTFKGLGSDTKAKGSLGGFGKRGGGKKKAQTKMSFGFSKPKKPENKED